MTRWLVARAVIVVIMGVGWIVQSAPQAGAIHQPTELAIGRQPRTDGATVVWSGPGYSYNTVYATSLDGGHIMIVASSSDIDERTVRSWPDVDGDFVVWREDQYFPPGSPYIRGKNLVTGEEFEVAHADSYYLFPAISGHYVVWTTGELIWLRDISTMAAPVVLAQADHGQAQGVSIDDVTIDGDRVAWIEEPQYNDGERHESRVKYLSIAGDGQVSTLVEAEQVNDIALTGEVLVYADALGLGIRDLGTGAETRFQNSTAAFASDPATDGRYVFWTELRERRADLRGYDVLTGSLFNVIFDFGSNAAADVAGGLLVWQRGFNEPTVHQLPLGDALPSGPRNDPGNMGERWTYFSASQHFLGFGFKDYWEANGGLHVFGYPLVEEFQEQGQDADALHTVQYLERQRFEYHPANEGTPYHVLLGRLGVQLLALQGRDWKSFPPADPGAAHYFPETEHAIAPEFYGYWSNHGLEFGDAGVSFRESLALFGYPISEPMMETNADGDTVLTQYFERAVFEHHPENAGTPYDVLLRRVGAEVLAARGWSAGPNPQPPSLLTRDAH